MHAEIIENNLGEYDSQKLQHFFSIYKENKKKAKVILPYQKCEKLNLIISSMQNEIGQKIIEMNHIKRLFHK